eukprot:400948-Prymnesium_polylepis.1
MTEEGSRRGRGLGTGTGDGDQGHGQAHTSTRGGVRMGTGTRASTMASSEPCESLRSRCPSTGARCSSPPAA